MDRQLTPTEQNLRRQLAAFAEFTTRSLGERNLAALMFDACIRARAGLNVTHAKLLEYLPNRDRLLLRSGVGWKEGYVGQYEVTPDVRTPIGHAFVKLFQFPTIATKRFTLTRKSWKSMAVLPA